jgi:hypothetical protein
MSNIGTTGRIVAQPTTMPTSTTTPAQPAAPSQATATGGALASTQLRNAPGLGAVASGASTLEMGARGEGVRAVQNGLRTLGFASTAGDGIYGRGTMSSVAAFQRSARLTPSGNIDAPTLQALDAALARRGPELTREQKLAIGGNKALNEKTKAHSDAIDKTGIGTHFGDHSYFNGLKANERKAWIEENKIPGTTPSDPRKSSCIGWAMENVKAAYDAAGMSTRWKEIERTVIAKGAKGTDLAKELQKDGWQAVYFNPDAKKPDDGNQEHPFTARQVAQGKPYYGIKVDQQVVNYRPTEGSGTTKDLAQYEKLSKIPFFFGLARGGTHTFVGQNGRVNEFHWDRDPNDKSAIEERPLTEFPWNSGVLMVPPKSWPR